MPVFDSFAQTAAPLAVAALWQGLAVAVLLALGLRLAPRIPAAQRFAVWAAGFAIAAVLPFAPVFAAHFAASPSLNLPAASPGAWLQLDPHWSLAIAALWLAASACRAADLLVHTIRLRSLWRSARPVDMPHAAAGRRFEVCTTSRVDRPSVIGFFAPRILIPDWLFARLTPAELDQIVLHEAEHLSRRDDWTNLAQKLALVAFPLSPALWWMNRRLAREREMACDEGVIRITRAPRAYAACLASLAERGLARRTQSLSLAAFERRPELVERVHSILRSRHALNPIAARALLGGLVCSLLVVSFELAQCPQLVAFVPAQPAPTLAAVAHTGSADPLNNAVYRQQPHAAQHLRAIPAKAVLPAQTINSAPASKPTAEPAEQLAALKHPANAPDSQQWIVFTAWEQVDAAPPATQATAGYDGTADAVVRPAPPAGRIRVTQLILRVVPQNPHASQPTAVPLGNGWFVIQL
ncbi:MAG: M56 family metallopeptidase [Terracidiphilus sp.]|nr:M56 family metallopeptidase [Terracidiphilus sp.]